MFRKLFTSLFFWLPLSVRLVGAAVRNLVGWSRQAGALVGRFWERFSHFQQNVVVGVLIAVALHLAHDTVWVRDVEDWAMDAMNRLQVDTPLLAASGEGRGRAGYTFIDMDEAAFTRWGEPYHVPRDQLLKLIRYAAEGGAAAIVVDVDFSRSGTDAAADEALKSYLATYPADAPPLILMRTFAPATARDDGPPAIRRAYFDAVIDTPAIHWAQPRFERDSNDRAIRRWRLVEYGCLDGALRWLPAPQLLVALLADPEAPSWTELERSLASATEGDCRHPALDDIRDIGSFRLAGREFDLFAGDTRQRVIYGFSAQSASGNEALDFRRVPAAVISGSAGPLSADPVRGRVVIIGASYQASHDVQATPVGDMPGALIILNAIKSLQQFGQLQGPPLWIKVLIEAMLILLMAWAFARFSSLGGTLLTGLAVALVLAPISFYVFRHGVWVDLAAPILGMQVHQVWADYEEAQAAKKRLRELERGAAAGQTAGHVDG